MVDLPEESNLAYLIIGEMQVTFILCLATNMVIGNPKWKEPVATLMIGITIFTGHLAGHRAGVGQMNPAKVLSTAILSGNVA